MVEIESKKERERERERERDTDRQTEHERSEERTFAMFPFSLARRPLFASKCRWFLDGAFAYRIDGDHAIEEGAA